MQFPINSGNIYVTYTFSLETTGAYDTLITKKRNLPTTGECDRLAQIMCNEILCNEDGGDVPNQVKHEKPSMFHYQQVLCRVEGKTGDRGLAAIRKPTFLFIVKR